MILENYYLRMAAGYEMKASDASNFIEKCALQDVAQAYHEIALYAVSKNARGRDDDADVQALAERMVANGHLVLFPAQRSEDDAMRQPALPKRRTA